jgi:hypothetical protein
MNIARMRLSQPKTRHELDMITLCVECNMAGMTILIYRFETQNFIFLRIKAQSFGMGVWSGMLALEAHPDIITQRSLASDG